MIDMMDRFDPIIYIYISWRFDPIYKYYFGHMPLNSNQLSSMHRLSMDYHIFQLENQTYMYPQALSFGYRPKDSQPLHSHI